MHLERTARRSLVVLCLAATPIWAANQPPSSPLPRVKAAATPASTPRNVALSVTDRLPRFSRSERYSAQRKPRVAVLDFEDTNQDARSAIYRDAVEAMLVTFLKRKSQFVVVERQKIGDVQDEWKLARTGKTNQTPGAQETFEALDAILVGSVTLLDAPSSVETVGKPSSSSAGQQGQRIEVDIKALARADGRIIAAAQSSGPIACLRSIVERLGVSLEQEFLRPYYGRLQVHLSAPENVRIFLTPILLDKAVDEEKPPVERGESVIKGQKNDEIEPWATNPTSYTIENLLGGWYTLRLERPGYHELRLATSNEDLFAERVGEQIHIRYRLPAEAADDSGRTRERKSIALQEAPDEIKRFVVYVDSRETRHLLGDGRHLDFSRNKKVGSLQPLAWRALLDDGYERKPQRVILIGKEELEINNTTALEEFAEDTTCDLFKEKPPERKNYSRTWTGPGQKFDASTFHGGQLVIEDYAGEPLPAGTYQIAFWEPDYELYTGTVVVNAGDDKRPFEAILTRKSRGVNLSSTGPRHAHELHLAGERTGTKIEIPLDFGSSKESQGLPVDRYVASTDIPGLRGWRSAVELTTGSAPPVYDATLDRELTKEAKAREAAKAQEKKNRPEEHEETGQEEAQKPEVRMPLIFPGGGGEGPSPVLPIKTRLAVGGRVNALSATLALAGEEVYVDPQIGQLLDAALGPVQATAPRRRWGWRRGRGESDAGAKETKKESSPEPVSFDGLRARALLLQELHALDYLILDDDDMARIKNVPDLAKGIQRYVEAGGTLFAFVSEPGDYSTVVGAPLSVKAAGRRSARFEIAPGTVPQVVLQLSSKKKVKVQAKRKLPQLESGLDSAWRVLAFTTASKGPRLIERGSRERGGYVVVWLDRPALFQTRFRGRPIPDIEQSRATVETHVLGWANTLMARRYDTPPESPVAQAAPSVLANSESRLKQLKQLFEQGLLSQEEYERKRAEILDSL